MKKAVIIISVGLLVLLNIVQFVNYNFTLHFADDRLPNFFDDVISDENTALEVAEDILISVYGEDISDEKPFNIRYDNIKKAWVISGKGSDDPNWLGGVASVIIRKKDGKVLKITHGM